MLEIVSIVSLVFAAFSLIYAFFALIQDYTLAKEVKEGLAQAKETASAAAKAATGESGAPSLAEGVQPQAAFGGAAEWLKALGAFAEGLSKLKQGLAAMVIALAFATLAAIAGGIEDKVADSDSGSTSSTATIAPTKFTSPPLKAANDLLGGAIATTPKGG
jgi:hypothetical protein